MGNWAQLPWIAIFNPKITKSAQSGYYIVYLFREDMKGVYISLNQGVTEYKINMAIKKQLEIFEKYVQKFRNQFDVRN